MQLHERAAGRAGPGKGGQGAGSPQQSQSPPGTDVGAPPAWQDGKGWGLAGCRRAYAPEVVQLLPPPAETDPDGTLQLPARLHPNLGAPLTTCLPLCTHLPKGVP